MKLEEAEEEENLNSDDIHGHGDLETDGINDDNNNNNSATESYGTTPSNSNLADNVKAPPAWPLTYGASMDILSTSPTLGLLSWQRNPGTKSLQTSATLPYDNSASLSQPLIDSSQSNKEDQSTLITQPRRPSSPRLSRFASNHSNRQCSTAQSVFNGVNILCGIGVLTIPYTIMQGGWLCLSQLGIFGAMAFYTGILLIRCLEINSSLKTYPDIGQAAFGYVGRVNISVILYFELFGTCVEFIILMSDNLATIFPNASLYIFGTRLACRQILPIVSSLIILPSVWLKDLSLLSYFSVGGVVALILVGICLVWIGTVDGVGFHATGSAINWAGLYATIGIYAYAFAGHSIFPNIYSSMSQPSRFPLVLLVSFVSCVLLSIGVGACGYLMFGDAVESQLTLSMPKQFVASKIAVWTMVVIPLTKYAMTLTPVALGVEELLPNSIRKYHFVSIVVRSLLVFSTLIVALTVPFFASVMAILGSVCSILVSFIIPCACYLRLYNLRLTKIQIASCSTIIVVSVICCCIGTYSAVVDLLARKNQGMSN